MDILRTIRSLAADLGGKAIGAVSMSWPREGEAAALVVSWAGMEPDADHGVTAPDGVTVMAWTSLPRAVLAVDVAGWEDCEDAMLDAAWRSGAWDVCRLWHPPILPCADWTDPRHGVASDFGLGDGSGAAVADLAAAGAAAGWLTWLAKPMADGPAWRRPLDVTLSADRDRRPADLPHMPVPNWSAPASLVEMRLGRGPDRPPTTHPRRRGGVKAIRPNRYSGLCAICGADVPVGAGWIMRRSAGKWRLLCPACRGTRP